MKLKLVKFEKLISNKEILEKALDKTKQYYRSFDPGQYLYNLLLEKREKIDIFSDEYIELIYTTLIAWNMNGRGARLEEIDKFKKSIKENKNKISLLKNLRLEGLNEKELNKTLEILNELFSDLKIVKTKSPLVTFSKTMHFLLPNLIVPIDRNYTLQFFYDHKNMPPKDKQFLIFIELHKKFYEISKTYNLKQYIDKIWNANIPKVIDNAIIGYSKL